MPHKDVSTSFDRYLIQKRFTDLDFSPEDAPKLAVDYLLWCLERELGRRIDYDEIFERYQVSDFLREKGYR